MKHISFYILALLLSVVACKQPDKTENIKVVGNPDSVVLNQYLSDESVCKYIFNDMIECAVVVNDSGPYHCFIKENVLGKKQIYYFCLDDVLKYNYIPEYDSLNYDLSLNYLDTERDKIKWSSKFERVPQMRQKSDEYRKQIETLDDAQDLSDFYNNSLYFQSDDPLVEATDRGRVLHKLIEITQVQLVGKYLRSVPNSLNAIVIGFRYVCRSYGILYWNNRFWKLNDYLVDLKKHLSNKEELRLRIEDRPKEAWNDDYRYYFSKYLQSIQQQNLNYMTKLFEDTDCRFDQYNFCYTVDYRYSDTRFFFFKIDWLGNHKITIHKNYINKEYLPTTRISNYYLYY